MTAIAENTLILKIQLPAEVSFIKETKQNETKYSIYFEGCSLSFLSEISLDKATEISNKYFKFCVHYGSNRFEVANQLHQRIKLLNDNNMFNLKNFTDFLEVFDKE